MKDAHKKTVLLSTFYPLWMEDYWDDVLTFFAYNLNIKEKRDSIVACHRLCPTHKPSQPPAFIVKFVYFDVKDRVWGRIFHEKFT